MLENLPLRDIDGALAAVCTTGAILPQMVRTWRTASAKDLSWGWFGPSLVGYVLWIINGLMSPNNIPMVVANIIAVILIVPIGLVMARTSGAGRAGLLPSSLRAGATKPVPAGKRLRHVRVRADLVQVVLLLAVIGLLGFNLQRILAALSGLRAAIWLGGLGLLLAAFAIGLVQVRRVPAGDGVRARLDPAEPPPDRSRASVQPSSDSRIGAGAQTRV